MFFVRRVASAAAVCMILCGTACAADSFDETRSISSGRSPRATDKPGETGGAKPKSAGGTWLTTLGSLTAVVGLIYLTGKVLRKGIPATQRTLPDNVVQILGRKPLDYRHAIHLVRCGPKILILGTSQAGLTPLGEIADPAEVDALAGLCTTTGDSSGSDPFQKIFRTFPLSRASATPAAHDRDSEADSVLLRLQSRLQQPAAAEADHRAEDRLEEGG